MQYIGNKLICILWQVVYVFRRIAPYYMYVAALALQEAHMVRSFLARDIL